VAAALDHAAAYYELQDAMRGAFGDPAEAAVHPFDRLLNQCRDALAKAAPQVQGDRATVETAVTGKHELVRKNGKWLVDYAASDGFLGGTAATKKMTDQNAPMAALWRAVAADVRAHKFASRDAATAERARREAALAAPAPRATPAQVQVARDDCATLTAAVRTFEVDMGRLPTAEEGLARLANASPARYISAIPQDPWGGAYVYRVVNNRSFEVFSAGPDGRPGTEDDIHAGE
jgi:general secretion pathway protein G